MTAQKSKATFVTFYSFKGGVGRSMALINTAGILAGQRGFQVLVIDVDLEAPGLSYLDPRAPDESRVEVQRQLPLEDGFVDLLTDAKLRGQAADLFTLSPRALADKYTRIIKIPDESRKFADGCLRVMSVGRLDSTYAARLNALNIGELYREGYGEPLVRAIKRKISESGLYQYVLVDSRTGLSDEAGMCTRDLADHLMILSGLNRQNVEGTSEFLRALRTATDGKKTLQVILSPVPNGEDKLADRREEVARSSFTNAWKAEIDLSLQIPYHPQLALTEEPHIFRRRKGYLFESYRAIERSMLNMLGHTAQAFYKSARASLRKKEYNVALAELQHMVRLERGRATLARLAEELAFPDRFSERPAGEEANTAPVSVESLCKDDEGRDFLTFVVDWLPAAEHDWSSRMFAGRLWTAAPALADKLYNRLLVGAPSDPSLLVSYAHFLVSRSDLDAAEQYFQRAIEADRDNSMTLESYANFLAVQRKELEKADHYYARAVQLSPEEADIAHDYANFLAYERGNSIAADRFYRKAVDLDPNDADVARDYANFLAHSRGELEAAETLYRRALELEPEDPYNLSDYGQFLVGKGQLDEGEKMLLGAFRLQPQHEKGNLAEICFSLWLLSRMKGADAREWEKRFKSIVTGGFKRHSWSFDRLLERASETLAADELSYAQAMAAAFLSVDKVDDLKSFSRWQEHETGDSNGASADHRPSEKDEESQS